MQSKTIKTPAEQVKEAFEAEISPTQKYRQTFYVSNDHHSLAEILSEMKPFKGPSFAKAAKEDNEVKVTIGMSSTTQRRANIVVGESDIISALHELEGDVFVCDIHSGLLRSIEKWVEALRSIYARYKTGEVCFEDIGDTLKKDPSIGERRCYMWNRQTYLGDKDFLWDEKNYIRAMKALGTKKIIPINIDLFDKKQQALFCNALKRYDITINLCNLTNLPDYDIENKLELLLDNIPWSDNPLITWNIHDRGMLGGSHGWDALSPSWHDDGAEYQFCCRTVLEFKNHIQEKPLFVAEVDSLKLFDHSTIETYRYTQADNVPFDSEPLRKKYLAHLEKATAILKTRKTQEYKAEILNRYKVTRHPLTRQDYNDIQDRNERQNEVLLKQRQQEREKRPEVQKYENDAQDNDINSYSQFLTLYHYASTTGTSLLVKGLVGIGATLALYKGATLCGLSVITTTVGMGLLTIGLFAKKPVENYIAMCADYQAAGNKEVNRENQAQM